MRPLRYASISVVRCAWSLLWAYSSSLFPLPFRLLQPLGHLLVLCGVERPAPCRGVPTVVLDGHVDAAVDEESHRLVRVRQEHQAVQQARRLVRGPICVDVCAVLEEGVRHVAGTIAYGPCE